jgi:hypothetical protein
MQNSKMTVTFEIKGKKETVSVDIPFYSDMSEVIRLLSTGDPKETYFAAMSRKVLSDANCTGAITTLLDRFLEEPPEVEERVVPPGCCKYCGEKVETSQIHICPDCDDCGHPADSHHPTLYECTDPECDCTCFVHEASY